MGFLNLFSKSTTAPALIGLPSGSFTVDREGEIIVSTVSSTFPVTTVKDIGRRVLESFREAREAQLPLAELIVHFGGFKIVARELRGGAIVYLSPKNLITPT
jgi:hypothetical protein